jgi:hypothetical protein
MADLPPSYADVVANEIPQIKKKVNKYYILLIIPSLYILANFIVPQQKVDIKFNKYYWISVKSSIPFEILVEPDLNKLPMSIIDIMQIQIIQDTSRRDITWVVGGIDDLTMRLNEHGIKYNIQYTERGCKLEHGCHKSKKNEQKSQTYIGIIGILTIYL